MNLVAANHAIFFNEWWNPSVNLQARDRVNRIGQKREVYITSFVIKDTIDERLQNIKWDNYINDSKLAKVEIHNFKFLRFVIFSISSLFFQSFKILRCFFVKSQIRKIRKELNRIPIARYDLSGIRKIQMSSNKTQMRQPIAFIALIKSL